MNAKPFFSTENYNKFIHKYTNFVAGLKQIRILNTSSHAKMHEVILPVTKPVPSISPRMLINVMLIFFWNKELCT
jgi:hypothetical protein